jgi:class 3 adenylate cyclase
MTREAHTFMFADISGYSLLTEREGDEAAAEMALRLVDKAMDLAAGYRAEVVKCLGDAVMVRSSDAAQTIRLGLDLLAECAEDPSLPPLHIGLHTGPAFERAGDWWGATVNIAARVAAAAETGQLLITRATWLAAGEMRSARLASAGRLRLKNIDSPIAVYVACRSDERPRFEHLHRGEGATGRIPVDRWALSAARPGERRRRRRRAPRGCPG